MGTTCHIQRFWSKLVPKTLNPKPTSKLNWKQGMENEASFKLNQNTQNNLQNFAIDFKVLTNSPKTFLHFKT
jgi:hypothetical protein